MAITDDNFSLLKSLPKTFFSGAFYSNLSRNNRFWGIVYWSVVLFLVLFAVHFKTALQLVNSRSPEMIQTIKQIPRIDISLGSISINKRLPYRVHYPHAKQHVFIDFLPSFNGNSLATWVVTPEQIFMRTEGGSYQPIDISNIGDMSLSNIMILNAYNYSLMLIFAIFLPVLWLFLTVVSGFIFLALAMFTWFLSGFLGCGCDYRTAYRLTVFASMPVLMLWGIYMMLPLAIPFFSIGLAVVLLLYLQFAASYATR